MGTPSTSIITNLWWNALDSAVLDGGFTSDAAKHLVPSNEALPVFPRLCRPEKVTNPILPALSPLANI
jgi:hypothetical protein